MNGLVRAAVGRSVPAFALLLLLSGCLPQNGSFPLPSVFNPPSRGGAMAPEAIVPHAVPRPLPPQAGGVSDPSFVPTLVLPVAYDSRASYYARRFNGRRTFTGERYDPKRFTAASRDLPLQSLVRVSNPKNGREVIVRINDLPRKRKTPLVDLSPAAARELGFFGKGSIRVRVLPLTVAALPASPLVTASTAP